MSNQDLKSMGFRKDLLGTRDMTAGQIRYILDMAKGMKVLINAPSKKSPHLQGKSIVSLFYENSTRTKMSFELAAKYLGGTSSGIAVSSSSVAKGENLIDTGKTLDMMGTDVIIIRHSCAGAPKLLADNVKAAVINAGDGMNEHPTQALLDAYTIYEKKGGFEGLKVAIAGDIYHSRVARSNIYALKKLGAEVFIHSSRTMLPACIEKTGAVVAKSLEEVMEDADVVMGLRIQKERQKEALFPGIREYSRFFGIDEKKLALASKDVLVMHPGPVNRGIELTSGVIDGKSSVINEQVMNGVAVRMALLHIFTRGGRYENIN